MTDRDLLAAYNDGGGNDAFRLLVERHVNLVYSVARRHISSAAAAEDITQTVFVELARNAARIPAAMPLVAWLHVVARRTAIDHVRRETRRAHREQQTIVLTETVSFPEPDWTAIAPLLDEAVEALRPLDRTAILLRFFENKPLHEIGAALGVSEDAAQKRVSRALDTLRAFLRKRGLAVSAGALAAQLPVQALTVAPAGLSAAITAKAVAATAAAHLTRTVAMATLHKTLLASACALALGAGGYGVFQIRSQQRAIAALREQLHQLSAREEMLRREKTAAQRSLGTTEAAIDTRLAATSAPAGPDAALVAQMHTWLARQDQLKAIADQRPDLGAPELKLLPDGPWISIASSIGDPNNEDDLKRAFLQLRARAANLMSGHLWAALKAYQQANAGAFPATAAALGSYDDALSPDILAQYQVLPSWKPSPESKTDYGPVLVRRTPVDTEHDMYIWVGPHGSGSEPALFANIAFAGMAYQQANNGQLPADPQQLVPYLKWPTTNPTLSRALTNALRAARR